ncbi:hypothetical protein [Nostoc sp.]|uniref:hypothetical protein n=1 Tax=Nostoc sp. TaxID=1180 RepID=UPI002FF89938
MATATIVLFAFGAVAIRLAGAIAKRCCEAQIALLKAADTLIKVVLYLCLLGKRESLL